MVVCHYHYQFGDDVGEKLLHDWSSLLKLLGPVLELANYETGVCVLCVAMVT